MKKLILAIVLIVISAVYIIATGGTYTVSFHADHVKNLDNAVLGAVVEVDDDTSGGVVSVEKVWQDGDKINVRVKKVSAGSAYLTLTIDGEMYNLKRVFVNKFGVITDDSRLGKCTGGWIIFVAIDIFLAVLLLDTIKKFRDSLKADFYSYHNISLMGIIIMLSSMFINMLLSVIYADSGFANAIRMMIQTAYGLSFYSIPLTFLILIPVAISNIVLLVREGKHLTNLLGTFFCLGILVFLIVPRVFDDWLQQTTIIDVHRETGWGHYFNMLVSNTCSVVLTYMLCILAGTIIMGVLATKKQPAFGVDYMLILGCQIRKDGSLTPLLRGRADAALGFASRQKEATGKELVFVPSGGKGSDEIMAEGEAIAKYLREKGVDEDHILVEDKSVNTWENFEKSLALIREREGDKEVNVAFATTNYHTFRSGSIATKQGIKAEGVGSRTKLYFGINAFVRECIATLYYEKKLHIMVLIALVITAVVLASIEFLSLIF